MIVFVVGGSKSKKSDLGEYIAEKLFDKGNLYYLATMNPSDDDDRNRILKHIKSREGHGYITIEKHRDINRIPINMRKIDTVLLDSITSLLTNEMFIGQSFYPNVSRKLYNEISYLSSKVKNIVIISDYISSDGIIYDEYTEIFRREMGRVNCLIAELSDVVLESTFGNITVHKGEERIKNEKLINGF